MANKISVGLNLFSANQTIYVSTGGGDLEYSASVPLDRVGETISALAKAHNADEIYLFGDAGFIEQTVYDTKFFLKKTFSNNNNVRIYVNGEIFN